MSRQALGPPDPNPGCHGCLLAMAGDIDQEAYHLSTHEILGRVQNAGAGLFVSYRHDRHHLKVESVF
jgi:hypothetical protein